MKTNWKVLLDAECPKCKGTGTTGEFRFACKNCLTYFSSTQLDAEKKAEKMPCSHGWEHLQEEPIICNNCEGEGRLSKQASLKDLSDLLDEVSREAENAKLVEMLGLEARCVSPRPQTLKARED